MGTTTTPNYGLIKPDGNEPGSNFPAQHNSNMDTLDSNVKSTSDVANEASARKGTTVRTTDSANVTSEAIIDSVTASLITGKIYKITWHGRFQSSVAGDDALFRIREDSLTGTEIASVAEDLTVIGRQARSTIEVEFTAVATASKTFKATLERLAGTGGLHGDAAVAGPTYFYVDYVRG
jgi:hypothetical protein